MTKEINQELRNQINEALELEGQRYSEPGRFSNKELREIARRLARLEDGEEIKP